MRTLYVTGLTDFQNVQDQERSKAEQDDDYALSQGDVTKFLIDIYLSLGGGWAPVEQQAPSTVTEAPKSDEDTKTAKPEPKTKDDIVHVSAQAS